MPLRREVRGATPGDEEDVARLRSTLAKLDPWMFWIVQLEPGSGAAFAVVGVTGAFVIAICGLAGYAEPAGKDLRIDGTLVSGFREAKRAARSIEGRLGEVSVFTSVDPMICLTRAVAGTSRTIRGTRVVRLEDLASEIGGRERTMDQGTAKTGAQALGQVLPRSSGARPEIEDV